jgi:heme exporter protein B
MLTVFCAMLGRDLRVAWRERTDILLTLGFFVVVVCLFPFGVGAEPNQLRAIAPGVIWVSALLSCLLSLPRLFAQDAADGVLDQLILSGEPAVVWVGAKVLAYWLASCFPVILAAPLLGLWLGLEVAALPVLVASLMLGTPVLAWLGAIGAALTLGLRSGGALLALLVLPLFIPVLIFGAGAVQAHVSGMGGQAHLMLLAGACAGTLALAPWACAASLRIAVE